MSKSRFCGLVLYNPKGILNKGLIMRSAFAFNCSFVATINHRYTREATDTPNALRHIPYYDFPSFDAFYASRPLNAELVGVEVNGKYPLESFSHPRNGVYIFGGEDRTLPDEVLKKCDYTVRLDTSICLNLAVCTSIVLWSRNKK